MSLPILFEAMGSVFLIILCDNRCSMEFICGHVTYRRQTYWWGVRLLGKRIRDSAKALSSNERVRRTTGIGRVKAYLPR